MTIETLIALADGWSSLGWAVQEQARRVVEDGDLEGQNPNAMAMFDSWLRDAKDAVPDERCRSDADDLLDIIAGARAAAK